MTMVFFLEGFLLGTAFSLFNHWIVLLAFKGSENLPEHKLKGKIYSRYLVRHVINILVLFSVYQNIPMLLGAAIGLTTVKNALVIKHLIIKKHLNI